MTAVAVVAAVLVVLVVLVVAVLATAAPVFAPDPTSRIIVVGLCSLAVAVTAAVSAAGCLATAVSYRGSTADIARS